MLRLALHGGLFSGKTTLADALVERSKFIKIDYTGILKNLTIEALKAIGVEVTLEEMLADKEKYRNIIIEIGRHVGFDDGYGLDAIVERLQDDQAYVLDNVRFDAQYEKLIEAGFILVRITTPMRFRVARAMAKGLTRSEFARRIEDSTESPLREFPYEVRISVDGDMAEVIDTLTAKLLQAEIDRDRAKDAAAGQAPAESDTPVPAAEELDVVATASAEAGS